LRAIFGSLTQNQDADAPSTWLGSLHYGNSHDHHASAEPLQSFRFHDRVYLASKPAAQLIGKSVLDTRTVPHASKTSQTCFEFPLYGFAYPI